MEVKFIGIKGTWRDVANAARTTIGLDAVKWDPPSEWKRKMLLCEHSPIRQLHFRWKWVDLKYWISVHFSRHKVGIEHWVKSQRPDRQGARHNRDDTLQGALIDHECEANAQAIINISRKRLCQMAMPETREAWQMFLESIGDIEPELYSVCVPDCVYRGHCFEYKSCGYHQTKEFVFELEEYRRGVNF